MLITIDKSKELTRKEYIDFLQKTKGETLSESRISQLVTAGKLKVRDYPELNNLQLIVLDDDEQALAQARFTTSQALHTYSYKELGLMMSKLIHDLTNENGNAKTLLSEKQTELDKLVANLGQVETERNEARQQVDELKQSAAQLMVANTALQADINARDEQMVALKAEQAHLEEVLADTQRKLDVETSFRGEFESFKTLVMEMLQQKSAQASASESEQKGKVAGKVGAKAKKAA